MPMEYSPKLQSGYQPPPLPHHTGATARPAPQESGQIGTRPNLQNAINTLQQLRTQSATNIPGLFKDPHVSFQSHLQKDPNVSKYNPLPGARREISFLKPATNKTRYGPSLTSRSQTSLSPAPRPQTQTGQPPGNRSAMISPMPSSLRPTPSPQTFSAFNPLQSQGFQSASNHSVPSRKPISVDPSQPQALGQQSPKQHTFALGGLTAPQKQRVISRSAAPAHHINPLPKSYTINSPRGNPQSDLQDPASLHIANSASQYNVQSRDLQPNVQPRNPQSSVHSRILGHQTNAVPQQTGPPRPALQYSAQARVPANNAGAQTLHPQSPPPRNILQQNIKGHAPSRQAHFTQPVQLRSNPQQNLQYQQQNKTMQAQAAQQERAMQQQSKIMETQMQQQQKQNAQFQKQAVDQQKKQTAAQQKTFAKQQSDIKNQQEHHEKDFKRHHEQDESHETKDRKDQRQNRNPHGNPKPNKEGTAENESDGGDAEPEHEHQAGNPQEEMQGEFKDIGNQPTREEILKESQGGPLTLLDPNYQNREVTQEAMPTTSQGEVSPISEPGYHYPGYQKPGYEHGPEYQGYWYGPGYQTGPGQDQGQVEETPIQTHLEYDPQGKHYPTNGDLSQQWSQNHQVQPEWDRFQSTSQSNNLSDTKSSNNAVKIGAAVVLGGVVGAGGAYTAYTVASGIDDCNYHGATETTYEPYNSDEQIYQEQFPQESSDNYQAQYQGYPNEEQEQFYSDPQDNSQAPYSVEQDVDQGYAQEESQDGHQDQQYSGDDNGYEMTDYPVDERGNDEMSNQPAKSVEYSEADDDGSCCDCDCFGNSNNEEAGEECCDIFSWFSGCFGGNNNGEENDEGSCCC